MSKKKVRLYFNPQSAPPKYNDADDIAHYLDIPISEIEIFKVAPDQHEIEFEKRRKYKDAIQSALDLYNSGLIENMQIVARQGTYNSPSDRVKRDAEVIKNLPKLANKKPNLKWNHDCVKFPQAIDYTVSQGKLDKSLNEKATDISVFQLDTGWSKHKAIHTYGGYNYQNSISTIKKETSGEDSIKAQDLLGNIQTKGHGTSTAHTFIGKTSATNPLDFPENYHGNYKGQFNEGLFPYISFTPVRIAKKVVFNLNFRVNAAKNMLKGVRHAIDNGADIITMSMGGELPHPGFAYSRASKLAYRNGVIFVCAAGNNKLTDLLFDVVRPADEPETIAVAGIAPNAGKYIPWDEGCDGEEIDVSAPASFVYTALKNSPSSSGDLYKFGHGTSQATVHVAAAAALWLHFFKDELAHEWFIKKPKRKVDCFRWALRSSSLKPSYWSKWELSDNKGILDVHNLIQPQFSPDNYRNQ